MLTKSKFRPAWWLRNPHAQTLWAAKVHPAPWPRTIHERITTPDGDFLDLNWTEAGDGAVVILFHGLTGSGKSRYIRSIMKELQGSGYRCVLMHFRGCSGEPNITAGSYHSGHTADIDYTINLVAQRYPAQKIIAVGYSLGGNALLKYLAQNRTNPLHFAMSISPPLLLAEGAQRLNTGFSKLYQWNLVGQLIDAVQAKDKRYPELKLHKLDYENIKTLVEFDEKITAPLHGYASAEDYYEKASTLADLKIIDTPTHIIFARNDPFFTENCLPSSDSAMSEKVTFEIIDRGGHVSFINGHVPLMGRDWLRVRVMKLITRAIGFDQTGHPLQNTRETAEP